MIPFALLPYLLVQAINCPLKIVILTRQSQISKIRIQSSAAKHLAHYAYFHAIASQKA